mmetsp:Transcript_8451/g.27687  ORF Transcript_8451/g.27687 Transcript_8451/m.27687 type:complete len:225 (+) Transcript_8451:989-1663(+)
MPPPSPGLPALRTPGERQVEPRPCGGLPLRLAPLRPVARPTPRHPPRRRRRHRAAILRRRSRRHRRRLQRGAPATLRRRHGPHAAGGAANDHGGDHREWGGEYDDDASRRSRIPRRLRPAAAAAGRGRLGVVVAPRTTQRPRRPRLARRTHYLPHDESKGSPRPRPRSPRPLRPNLLPRPRGRRHGRTPLPHLLQRSHRRRRHRHQRPRPPRQKATRKGRPAPR